MDYFCDRCETHFKDHDSFEAHSCTAEVVAQRQNPRGAFETMQYQLKEALLEIGRHHADFLKVRGFLDDYEKALDGEDQEEYARRAHQALKGIRNVVG